MDADQALRRANAGRHSIDITQALAAEVRELQGQVASHEDELARDQAALKALIAKNDTLSEMYDPPMPNDVLISVWNSHYQELLTLAAEVRELRERVAQQERITERALAANVEQREELERLRARDEAAKAVVQTWMVRVTEAGCNQEAADELTAALDELARAHEDGGQDRG